VNPETDSAADGNALRASCYCNVRLLGKGPVRLNAYQTARDAAVRFDTLQKVKPAPQTLFFVGHWANKLPVPVPVPAAFANVKFVPITQSFRTFSVPPVIVFRFSAWCFTISCGK